MQLEAGPRSFALDSTLPDVGLGSVWPTAVLGGASLAAAGAAGAWIGGALVGANLTWSLAVWSAEHALWGTAVGAVVALGLRLAVRGRPVLADPVRRRALGLGLSLGAVLLALAVPLALGLAYGSGETLAGTGLGMLVGLLLWALAARRVGGLRGLQRLDPARVAALVALVTIPLANAFDVAGGDPPSLLEVWRTLLGS